MGQFWLAIPIQHPQILHFSKEKEALNLVYPLCTIPSPGKPSWYPLRIGNFITNFIMNNVFWKHHFCTSLVVTTFKPKIVNKACARLRSVLCLKCFSWEIPMIKKKPGICKACALHHWAMRFPSCPKACIIFIRYCLSSGGGNEMCLPFKIQIFEKKRWSSPEKKMEKTFLGRYNVQKPLLDSVGSWQVRHYGARVHWHMDFIHIHNAYWYAICTLPPSALKPFKCRASVF